MTTAITKMFREEKDNPLYDPCYEMVPNPKKAGKFKKVEKQIPSYISTQDAKILAKARKRAYKLDFCLFNFLGFRFGWSSIIGLLPVIGDSVDALLAIHLIFLMRGVAGGLPNMLLARMVTNMIVNFVVGLIPFVGDLADAAIKCNSKNVCLFEEHLSKTYKPRQQQKLHSVLPAEPLDKKLPPLDDDNV